MSIFGSNLKWCFDKALQKKMKELEIKSIVVKKYQYQKYQGTGPDDKEKILVNFFCKSRSSMIIDTA